MNVDTDRLSGDIGEALSLSREYLTIYDTTVQQAAMKGVDPKNNRHVTKAHIELQSVVLYTFNLLRADIRTETPRYWKDAVLYEDPDTGEQVKGLRQLDGYAGGYKTTVDYDMVRQQGLQRQVKTEPILLPILALRQAVHLMGEVAKLVGYTPDVAKRERTGKVPTEPKNV